MRATPTFRSNWPRGPRRRYSPILDVEPFPKNVDPDYRERVRMFLEEWRFTVDTPSLVGRSGLHRDVLDKLTRVAPTDAEVLIIGPSGVGKELYARHVHLHSHRSAYGFVPVNCGALCGDLLENTLFGHVGGAFTGAVAQRDGLVSEAEGGTLFLDEVELAEFCLPDHAAALSAR